MPELMKPAEPSPADAAQATEDAQASPDASAGAKGAGAAATASGAAGHASTASLPDPASPVYTNPATTPGQHTSSPPTGSHLSVRA
ncbi:hypothetical protein [Ideonella sp. BN130291]|uniref:hypothetical protein n=1 Tax=Ideonella sp. BN130291 TaxID=3112940 RepID=UPI002E256818|nr:hypothetical protein [Ideonella sp. BN130291]